MSNFAFTSTGTATEVTTDLASKPAAYPGFPQTAADLITAQLADVPADKTVTLTVQGNLGWETDQIAGLLSLSIFANVTSEVSD
jgi:hypothetical protein